MHLSDLNKSLLLYAVAALLATAAFLGSCTSKMPVWNGKVYVGNHDKKAIERRQAGEVIDVSDPRFSSFICIDKRDYDCFLDTYLFRCEKWSGQSPCGLPVRQE